MVWTSNRTKNVQTELNEPNYYSKPHVRYSNVYCILVVFTVHEVPFSSKSKFQLSVHHLESGPKPFLSENKTKKILLVMKGAPEKILERCSTVRLGEANVPVTNLLAGSIIMTNMYSKCLKLNYSERPKTECLL